MTTTTQTATDTMSATFRSQTGKRKFSAPFPEDGSWWIIDSAGHQWALVDGDWIQFTDDDDPHVVDITKDKRARARKAAYPPIHPLGPAPCEQQRRGAKPR